MSTETKIKELQKELYNAFKGRRMATLEILHVELRRALGDEKYLEYLENQQLTNPRPKYKPIKL